MALIRRRHRGVRLWSTRFEANEVDNAKALPGLGRYYFYDGSGGVEDSGNASRPASGVTSARGHSGTRSMRHTIGVGTAEAGARNFMNRWTQEGRTLFYSAWVFLPLITLEDGGYHQLWQVKVNEAGLGSYAVAWKLNIYNPGASRMALDWVWELGKDADEEGPRQGEDYTVTPLTVHSPIDIPANQWVRLEVYMKQSFGFRGHVKVWQDRTKIFDFPGIKTKTAAGTNRWSVNNYGANLDPNSISIDWDDIALGTGRMGRRV